MAVTHRLTTAPDARIAWCACGEGFSGARVHERAAAHVANPDPDGLGAMLIAALLPAR